MISADGITPTAPAVRARVTFAVRFLRHRAATVGLTVVLLVIAAGVLAPALAPRDPFAQNLEQQFAPPGAGGLLGTDQYGRDLLSRILWGTRYSLMVAMSSLLLGATLGIALGLTGGYFGGWADAAIIRLVDALMSFPLILIAIFAVSVLGFGTSNVILALGVSLSPRFARVVRSQVLAIMSRDYVDAARALGAGHWRLMTRHVLMNALGPVIVLVTLYLPYTILVESSLSFLGIGVSPDTPTWGRIIADGAQYLASAPWVSVAPGVAIALTSMGFNLLGDGLRDLLDPKLRTEAR